MAGAPEMICWRCQAACVRETRCEGCEADPRLNGRWMLEALLGEGATGATYRARDLQSDRRAAIKELSFRKVRSVKALELFDREIAVLRRIDHPAVPEYYDDFVVEEPGRVHVFLVQELIDGAPLSLQRPTKVDEVLGIVMDLCEVLTVLHRHSPPIIHRDIKPSNVMRRRDGRLVLIDFGAVRNVARDAQVGGSTVAGTFGYMAPEQLRGVALPASDLYGVGATAIALLAGRDAAQLLDPVRPTQWRDELHLPDRIEEALAELVDPDETRRPSDAQKVKRKFAALAESGPEDLVVAEVSAPARRDEVEGAMAQPAAASGDAAVLARLRRQWRRVSILEAVEVADWWIPMVLVGPLLGGLGWGWAMLAHALDLPADFASSALGIGSLVAALMALFVIAKLRWIDRNPWRHGIVRASIMRSWPHRDKFEAEIAEGMNEEPKFMAASLRDEVGRARAAWDERGGWILPVLESQAYAQAHLGNPELAAEILDDALALGRRHFGEGDPRRAEQQLRYAMIFARSEGRREDALALYEAGNALARALETAHGKPFALVLAEAVQPVTTGRASVEAQIRRRKRIDGILFMVPPKLASADALITVMFGSMISAPITGAIVGAFSVAPPLAFAAVASVFVGLPWLAGPRLHRRFGHGDWRRRLFPDFDAVWPTDHPSRAMFMAVAERAWHQPFRIGSAAYDNLRRLVERHGDQSRRGGRDGRLDVRQRRHVAVLEVLGAHHVSQITEQLAKLADVAAGRATRGAVLRRAAVQAWKEGIEDLAVAWWTEAEGDR